VTEKEFRALLKLEGYELDVENRYSNPQCWIACIYEKNTDRLIKAIQGESRADVVFTLSRLHYDSIHTI